MRVWFLEPPVCPICHEQLPHWVVGHRRVHRRYYPLGNFMVMTCDAWAHVCEWAGEQAESIVARSA